jgi:hypothetical protein
LPSLAASDARANRPDDCFDFTQAPRPFQALATRRSAGDFIRAVPSYREPDAQ